MGRSATEDWPVHHHSGLLRIRSLLLLSMVAWSGCARVSQHGDADYDARLCNVSLAFFCQCDDSTDTPPLNY